jgi:uncharacterized membrane protein
MDIGSSSRVFRTVVLLGLLAIMTATIVMLSVSAEEEDLQLGQVTYSRYDSDLDGLMDHVEVTADVINGNGTLSKIFTLEVVLSYGNTDVDLQTSGGRLDPLDSTTVTLKVGTDFNMPGGTFLVKAVLHADYLQGPIKDENETSVELYPLGEYDIDLSSNRSSADAWENTSVDFSITVSSLSNNPTDVDISLTSTLGWPYQLETNTVSLDPDEEVVLNLRVLVPHNAPPGSIETFALEAEAVRSATAFSTLSLNVRVALQEFDLGLELTSDRVFVASGETVTVTGFVTNRGNNQDNVTLIVDLPQGWTSTFDPPLLMIDRGTTLAFDMHITAPSGLQETGVFDANVTALSKGLVAEDARVLRVVFNTAELAIDMGNVTVSPETPAAGDEVTIQATVVNAGAITASGVVVALTSDIGEVARTTLDDLVPGSLGVATLKWTPPPGSHLVRVVVDPDGEIAETDEDNNQVSIIVMVSSPDLSIVPGDIAIDPSYPTESSVATIRIVITNTRQLLAGPFNVRVTVDGEDLGTREVASGLVGGANVTLELPWTATPGRHTFKVEVDPDGDVLEEDLSNNVASRSFSVNARPQAILKASEEEIKTGDEVTLDANGSIDTDGRIRQYFFDYGDGTDSGWTFFATVNHVYADAGEYEVRLYVRDEADAQNQEPTMVTIKVTSRDGGEESSPGPVAIVALLTLAIVAFALILHRRDGEDQ